MEARQWEERSGEMCCCEREDTSILFFYSPLFLVFESFLGMDKEQALVLEGTGGMLDCQFASKASMEKS